MREKRLSNKAVAPGKKRRRRRRMSKKDKETTTSLSNEFDDLDELFSEQLPKHT